MRITIQPTCDDRYYSNIKIISELNEKLNAVLAKNEELKKQIDELRAVKPIISKILKSISQAEFEKCQILCEENKLDELKVYLDEYCDAAIRNNSGIFRYAARHGKFACVKLLIEHGADIHAENDYAIRWAAENGHVPCVKLLITKGANVRANNDDALRSAAKKGHLECVELLIDHGANVHAQVDSAIYSAVKNGHLKCAELLIKRGADVRVDNNIAICVAAEYGHLECVKLLIDQGADVHANNDYAIRWAAYHKHVDVVEYLAENGADVRAFDSVIINSYINHDVPNSVCIKRIVEVYLKYGGANALIDAKSCMKLAIEKFNFGLADIFHECGVVLEKNSDPKVDKYFALRV